jgi:hypothetical protein
MNTRERPGTTPNVGEEEIAGQYHIAIRRFERNDPTLDFT